MLEFNLYRPGTLQEALKLLAEFKSSARVLAGGTDLLISLGSREREDVKNIIDITSLRELDFIREEDSRLRLGPLTVHAQIADSPHIRQGAGLLAAAAAAIGSPQIRNRGTIGGNIVNAAVCADTVPPLLALGATVKLERLGESRWLPLEEFITGPNRTGLEADEMLTEIAFAKLPATAGWGFMRLARREAMAIARMNVAVILDRDSRGRVVSACIAPGAVLASPARIPAAENILLGQCPDEERIHQAGQAVAAAMTAAGRRWSTPYKEPAIIALTERAIKQALEVEWR